MSGPLDPLDAPAPGRRSAGRGATGLTGDTGAAASGRGRGRGRFDVGVVLAVLLPLLVVVAALGVHADAGGPDAGRAPTVTSLDRVSLICPSGGAAQVTTLTDAGGTVSTSQGGTDTSLPLVPDRPADARGTRALVVTGRDALAPGLLAGRFADPLASAECRSPQPDEWFTGAGAGARHDSVIELVNPDAGRAVVDVQVLSHTGLVDAAGLQGIAVPGGETVRIDLFRRIPRRDALALHVTTVRGRVTASVADRFDQLGGGDAGSDWLPAQAAPSNLTTLLGLPDGEGRRLLVLANPTDDEGRATLDLVTPQSVITPEGAGDVRLPPHSVVRLSVSKLLRSAAASGGGADERPVGLQVDSTVPVTADLFLFLDGDLAHVAPSTATSSAASALLPDGRRTLVLSGATGPGVATVSTWDAQGVALDDVRVALAAGESYSVDLPGRARLLTVTPERTPVASVVVAVAAGGDAGSGGSGVTEVRPQVPLSSAPVPDVRPGTP